MTLVSHQQTVGKSQNHITPKWIIDRLGPFDLDPCAADRLSTVRARRHGASATQWRERNMKILGVDPGIHGGLAIIEIIDGAAAQLVTVSDIPVSGTGAKERVDVLAIRTWVLGHRPQHAYIERAQGASNGFKYGRAVGALEGVLACCGIPMTIVDPSAWKKFHQLRGGDKEGGRQRALQLFPSAHAWLARKKDHGRAEAALIALYGASRIAPTEVQHAAA